ncbi:hypothetical protein PQX77_021062 [Marasmius sp. AFHP31]|nr:hypothetical protein PQX77_021062 [Marasmius sp. AFHP31]
MADFQKAVDKLEGLIVARLFELTKMNMSGTGYRLRKHIAQALKARSKMVRTALEQYNAAAEKCGRELLEWEKVVEQEVWAKPAGRLAMDQYFKILGAREEITHLNVEIRQLMTSIRDEGVFLHSMYNQTLPTNPPLAHQIEKFRLNRARYNHLHMERLTKLSMTEGFTGCLYPGEFINGSPQSSLPGRPEADGPTAAVYDHGEDAPPEEEEERDQGEDQEDIEDLSELCEVVRISED